MSSASTQKYENVSRRNFDRFPESKLAVLVSHFYNIFKNTGENTDTNTQIQVEMPKW